jgi:ABC-2 type transport system permease protein
MIKRILLIARRDYVSSVMNKAFLIGLLVLPLMMGAFLFASLLLNRGGEKPQRIAVIDHTGYSAAFVIQAAKEKNRREMFEPVTGRQVQPLYIFEEAKPERDEPAQRLLLSERIRKGELTLFLEIQSDSSLVRYYTNSTGPQLNGWLTAAVNDGLRRARLSQLGIDPSRIEKLSGEVKLVSMSPLTRDPETGKIQEAKSANPLRTVVVPFFLAFLMLMTVMIGSAQKLGAVAEDKLQRVFEMLLVAASPFEMMMGKVLSSVGISLTSSIVYIAIAILALAELATMGLAPLHLLPWFFAYLIGDVVMLAALAAALGSTCGTPQEAQSFGFVLFMPVLIPMFLVRPIIEQPNGLLAVAMSLFPPFTPLLMLFRQALPAGVPSWQPWVGLAGVVLTAVFVTWTAARIFRIGILSQGRTPKVSELVQWVLHG